MCQYMYHFPTIRLCDEMGMQGKMSRRQQMQVPDNSQCRRAELAAKVLLALETLQKRPDLHSRVKWVRLFEMVSELGRSPETIHSVSSFVPGLLQQVVEHKEEREEYATPPRVPTRPIFAEIAPMPNTCRHG